MWRAPPRKEARASFDQAQMNEAINNDLDEHQAAVEGLRDEMRAGFNKIYWALIVAGLSFAGSVAAYVITQALAGGP